MDGPFKTVAHGEWGGGSRLRPWIMIPGDDNWHVIDPGDPTQSGFWRIPFDSSISDQLSAYSFYKHGGISAMDLQSGNFGFSHALSTSPLKGVSGTSLNNQRWYHLHKQVNQNDGSVELYIDGSLAVSKSFDQDDALEDDIESEWIIGSGTISSSVDEIRISATNRSVIGSWQPMKIKGYHLLSPPKLIHRLDRPALHLTAISPFFQVNHLIIWQRQLVSLSLM